MSQYSNMLDVRAQTYDLWEPFESCIYTPSNTTDSRILAKFNVDRLPITHIGRSIASRFPLSRCPHPLGKKGLLFVVVLTDASERHDAAEAFHQLSQECFHRCTHLLVLSEQG